ncbi:Fic family protein [Abyssalbus ytuae]|uniref:Fic family protein n=1 Tax=Abyssalbus ytuae TaxID=2926907 RepID=A0A9E6ZQI4_9FLAO|nr:Fic family protein [Abyssalbus ytuae]UOB18650.1 Fic family protein [Abyssalbus ytuae]
MKREQLLELLENQEEISKLSELEKEYPYWEKFKHKAKGLTTDPKLLWKFVKLQQDRNVSRIKICDTNSFNFKYNISGNTLERLHKFDLNFGGVLEGSSIIPDKDKDRFLISSLMEEAIASSQLEGAITTREVAKAILRTKRKPKNPSERMILNNYITIKEIITLKGETLTPEIIKQIHSLITKNTLDKQEYEGEFRTSDNVKVVDDITGEVFYDPPKFEDIEKLMNSFCEFANSPQKDKDFIHPIIRGIILHFLIGYIHPFVDGNGRTARAIFYWYLIKQGYWLVEFLSISRIIIKSPGQYARASLYTEYDENDLTYFIDFNLKSMELALKSLKEYIHRKISEKKNLFKIIRSVDVNERQAEIIKNLINEPESILSINEIQSKFGTSYQTARTDLMELESKGYLSSKMTGKKFIYFKSPEFNEKIKKSTLPNNI